VDSVAAAADGHGFHDSDSLLRHLEHYTIVLCTYVSFSPVHATDSQTLLRELWSLVFCFSSFRYPFSYYTTDTVSKNEKTPFVIIIFWIVPSKKTADFYDLWYNDILRKYDTRWYKFSPHHLHTAAALGPTGEQKKSHISTMLFICASEYSGYHWIK